MSDECECPPCPEGLPDWLATFADLMSLLMCFFVLLLSFSVIDAQKYKQIAGSMRMAFGVQRDVEVQEPPKGVSIIAQEFSPSMSEPTPLNVVQQQTTEFNDPNLEVPREQLEKALQEEVEKEIEQLFGTNLAACDQRRQRHRIMLAILPVIHDNSPFCGYGQTTPLTPH